MGYAMRALRNSILRSFRLLRAVVALHIKLLLNGIGSSEGEDYCNFGRISNHSSVEHGSTYLCREP